MSTSSKTSEPNAPQSSLIDGYEVGYGKPPKANRFKPGNSGNKKGRPKGHKNFNTDLKDVLASKTTVTENGRSKSISTQRAAMEVLRQKALKGDARALDKIIDLASRLSEAEETQVRTRDLIKEDTTILERFLASHTEGDLTLDVK